MNEPRITREDLEHFSDMIAALTIAHGVDRIITQDVLRERCRHYTEVAKLEVEEETEFGGEARMEMVPRWWQ